MGLGDLIKDDGEDDDSGLKEFLESKLEESDSDDKQSKEPSADSVGEDEIDVTDTIKVYENGKTWECPCGSGNGTEKALRKMKCAVCGKELVDTKYLEREDQEPLPPRTKGGTEPEEDDTEEVDHGFW